MEPVRSSWNHTRQKSRHSYIPSDYLDQEDPITGHVNPGQWRNSVPASGDSDVPLLPGCRATREFFNGPGALPWQENILE